MILTLRGHDGVPDALRDDVPGAQHETKPLAVPDGDHDVERVAVPLLLRVGPPFQVDCERAGVPGVLHDDVLYADPETEPLEVLDGDHDVVLAVVLVSLQSDVSSQVVVLKRESYLYDEQKPALSRLVWVLRPLPFSET